MSTTLKSLSQAKLSINSDLKLPSSPLRVQNKPQRRTRVKMRQDSSSGTAILNPTQPCVFFAWLYGLFVKTGAPIRTSRDCVRSTRRFVVGVLHSRSYSFARCRVGLALGLALVPANTNANTLINTNAPRCGSRSLFSTVLSPCSTFSAGLHTI